MRVLLHEPDSSPRECGHLGAEFLGSEGNASFYRCPDCGNVVIVAGANRWVFHRAMLP